MKTIALNVLSEQSNLAIVQMTGRKFPGCVIQGDSLAILCSEAKEISERLLQIGCTDEELLCLAQEHQTKLLGRLLHYQQILSEHGIPLPCKAVKPSDLIILREEGEDDAL